MTQEQAIAVTSSSTLLTLTIIMVAARVRRELQGSADAAIHFRLGSILWFRGLQLTDMR